MIYMACGHFLCGLRPLHRQSMQAGRNSRPIAWLKDATRLAQTLGPPAPPAIQRTNPADRTSAKHTGRACAVQEKSGSGPAGAVTAFLAPLIFPCHARRTICPGPRPQRGSICPIGGQCRCKARRCAHRGGAPPPRRVFLGGAPAPRQFPPAARGGPSPLAPASGRAVAAQAPHIFYRRREKSQNGPQNVARKVAAAVPAPAGSARRRPAWRKRPALSRPVFAFGPAGRPPASPAAPRGPFSDFRCALPPFPFFGSPKSDTACGRSTGWHPSQRFRTLPAKWQCRIDGLSTTRRDGLRPAHFRPAAIIIVACGHHPCGLRPRPLWPAAIIFMACGHFRDGLRPFPLWPAAIFPMASGHFRDGLRPSSSWPAAISALNKVKLYKNATSQKTTLCKNKLC